MPPLAPPHPSSGSTPSSLMNVPGESTLRREFLRLQQEHKGGVGPGPGPAPVAPPPPGPAHDPEAHVQRLLLERQRRLGQQREERRRLEEVGGALMPGVLCWGGGAGCLGSLGG